MFECDRNEASVLRVRVGSVCHLNHLTLIENLSADAERHLNLAEDAHLSREVVVHEDAHRTEVSDVIELKDDLQRSRIESGSVAPADPVVTGNSEVGISQAEVCVTCATVCQLTQAT